MTVLSSPCAKSLETGAGTDVNGACPDLTENMKEQAQCLSDKITALGITYSGPSATIRSLEYQTHLREVWDKNVELKRIIDPKIKQACASLRAEIDRE